MKIFIIVVTKTVKLTIINTTQSHLAR